MTRNPASPFGTGFVPLGDGPAPKGRQVALVPGALVPILSLELPAGLHGEAREQVARRQVLDRMGLTDAAVEMRPFHSKAQRDIWNKVLIADAQRMGAWRKGAVGAKAVLPDYLALPTANNVWSFAATPDGIAMRFGPEDGFSATLPVAVLMVQKRLLDGPPDKLLRLGDAVPEIEALFEVPVLETLSEAKVLGHGELSFDLRRDPRQARVRLRRQVLPWRWPVLIGALAACIWASAQLIETRKISQRTDTLRAETRQLVRSHFVPNGPILDMRRQVSAALLAQSNAQGQATRATTALDLFERASAVVAVEQARPETITSAAAGEVTMVLKVENFAAVDQLAAALSGQGLQVDVIESRVSDSDTGVRTEMRITEAAP